MRHSPVVLGIVGNPVDGRLSFAEGISNLLGGKQSVTRLSTGDYRKYDRIEADRQKLTEAHPGCVRLEMLEQHLTLLKRGEAVYCPGYNRRSGLFEVARYVEPRGFIVIDGELGFFTQGLLNNLDLRVFYSSSASVEAWQTAVASDAAAYVESQRKWADLVIEDLSTFSVEKRGQIALTLRPTLPRVALQELIHSAGEQHGVKLVLARDMGLPVDRIEIDEAISDKAAAYYKKRLIAEMPSEYRTNADVEKGDGNSAAQVLSQLLVALHLLKIASS